SGPHPREEAIEWPRWRSARPDAPEVVDAAVAGADEAPGRLHEPHRTADVRAARRHGDVLVPAVAGLGVDLRVAPADVDEGLARLAGVRDEGDHRGHVCLGVEVPDRANVLPARLLLLLEDRA